MWMMACSRRQFLSLLASGAEPSVTSAEHVESWKQVGVGGAEMTLVWEDDPRLRFDLPECILLRRDDQRDFLAWAATYLRHLRPLTAYCRVLEPSLVELVQNVRSRPRLDGLEDACAGAIMGEALTQTEGRAELRSLSVRACASTYSYATARGLAIGVLRSGDDAVTRGWNLARKVTRQAPRALGVGQLRPVWDVVLELAETPGFRSPMFSVPRELSMEPARESIARAARDLSRDGEVSSAAWEALTRGDPGLKAVREGMGGSREDRVVLFERASRILGEPSFAPDEVRSFIIGYLGSRLAVGTVDHFEVVNSNARRLPAATVWYGVCAGLYKKSDIKDHAGGLGRRLIRDLLETQSPSERPRCDIAVSELEMLLGAENPAMDFKVGSHGQVVVEIVPNVTTTVKWPPRADIAPVEATLPLEVVPQAEDPHTLLGELGAALGHAVDLYRKLAGKPVHIPRGSGSGLSRKRRKG